MPALDGRLVERDRRDPHGRTPTLCYETTPGEEPRAAAKARAGRPCNEPTAIEGPSSLGLEPRRGTLGSDRVVRPSGVRNRATAGPGPALAAQSVPQGP